MGAGAGFLQQLWPCACGNIQPACLDTYKQTTIGHKDSGYPEPVPEATRQAGRQAPELGQEESLVYTAREDLGSRWVRDS